VVLVFHELVPIWPAVVVTIVIVLGLAALVTFRIVQRHRTAARLEKALEDQAKADSGMRPDQLAEISAMQAEFRKAWARSRPPSSAAAAATRWASCPGT
jgi:type VI protein secretion system component VasK